MTPMIDIVFQLNIFFLFTFKIVLPEGDFNVQMPSAAAARAAEPSEIAAAAAGDAGRPDRRAGRPAAGGPVVRQRPRRLRSAAELHPHAGRRCAAARSEEQEVEIDADYNLNYDYVVRAITAVTGYIENGQPHKLIERIKFTPPKKQYGARCTQ